MSRILLVISLAAAFAFAEPADASECIAGCKVPLRACLESVHEQKDVCVEACEETPPGEARGACLRECATAGASGFAICRDELHGCRDLCVTAPIECRSGCIDTAMACRAGARETAATCRDDCQTEATALLADCRAASGDRGTCSDAAGERRSECLDDCGFAQSLELEGCGSAFEQCVIDCTPPDADETERSDVP
jgi:hypothetical protein